MHRDVKLANIVLFGHDSSIAKLADFGLAAKYYGNFLDPSLCLQACLSSASSSVFCAAASTAAPPAASAAAIAALVPRALPSVALHPVASLAAPCYLPQPPASAPHAANAGDHLLQDLARRLDVGHHCTRLRNGGNGHLVPPLTATNIP